MSLIIRGIDMPKNCADCFLEDAYDGYNCRIAQKSANWGLVDRPSWCPLVEVPTPHGDLIDTNDVQSAIDCWLIDEDDATIQDYKDAIGEILESPTVVPAEDGE